MPERIVIPITRCKYEKHKDERGVIKIDTEYESNKRTKSSDKRFLKRNMGIEKPTFTEFVVELGKEDGQKLEKFCNHLESLNKCLNCGKAFNVNGGYMNDNFELVMPCNKCLSNNIDSSKESKEYCRWWDAVLTRDYGLTFKDGFPKAVRAQWGTKCFECGGSHDGGGLEFNFVESF